MNLHIDHLTPIATITMVALICGLVFTRMKQPAIIGYILAGCVLGPTGFALIDNSSSVQLLAELGVIMLLFLIGMELSLRGFRTVYKTALLTASLQIFAFTLIAWMIGSYYSWSMHYIMILGFSLALSSTAVAIKILENTGELRNQTGKLTVSILIAQDLAVVPMILILNALSPDGSAEGTTYLIILKLFFSIGGIALLTWFLSRRERLQFPMIEWIESRSDITPLAALAMCFTLATLSGALGLSTAYGAFLAGLIIGNSNARVTMHQATEPIQAVLMMVFFLSIGLLIDLDFVFSHLPEISVVLLIVIFVKTMINFSILRALGTKKEQAFRVGSIIGQVGEFSFILVAAGLSSEALDTDGYKFVISIIALSLMISPLWIGCIKRPEAVSSE